MSLLEVDTIHSYYGQIHALKGISVEVNVGEIVTLIGSNGAGKSTTLRTISGMMHPRKGRISFNGKDISKKEPHQIVHSGMVHVPEGRGIFPTLTVKENLEMGAFTVTDSSLIEERMENGFSLFPRLKERIDQFGGTLSGGEQQMLAIARGLMMDPQLLMLDEPSMGLAPILVELIFDIIRELNAQKGTTILLVEQNALMALSIAHRGYVMQTGEITVTDTAANLRDNEEVQKAYLGVS
jgi:branched-chain amino acid transport system ATP-binding protein